MTLALTVFVGPVAAAPLQTFDILRNVPEDRIVGTQDEARRVAGEIPAPSADPAAGEYAEYRNMHAAAQHSRKNLLNRPSLARWRQERPVDQSLVPGNGIPDRLGSR